MPQKVIDFQTALQAVLGHDGSDSEADEDDGDGDGRFAKLVNLYDGSGCGFSVIDAAAGVPEMETPEDELYYWRPAFIDDVSTRLYDLRHALGLSSREFALQAGLSRQAVTDIEKAGRLDGPALGTVGKYLAVANEPLRLRLRHRQDGKRQILLAFSAKDNAAEYCADFSKRMRQEACMTQRELDRMCAGDHAAATRSGFISRIERGKQQSGTRLGTLFLIAFHCGFILSAPSAAVR